MAARKVKFVQGEYYHIYNRGAERVSIFRNNDNYVFCLRLIKKYVADLSISLIAYCLMPNHYHLLVRQDGDDRAGLLPQRVFNSYTKAFNKVNDRKGTLFEGPFEAKHVGDDSYLHHLCRYIHANPVVSGMAMKPELWPYSNYLEWIEERPGTLVDRSFIQAHFGGVNDYRAYVQSYLTGEVELPAELKRYLDSLERGQ